MADVESVENPQDHTLALVLRIGELTREQRQAALDDVLAGLDSPGLVLTYLAEHCPEQLTAAIDRATTGG